ncbi:UDP-N-acetylenolpyruvoylglucosamine reductase [Halomonas sp. 1513]|nr:UDP-N-acetylmuramate dehydrogenase [Halomonas sp. 1513]APX93261.1 UDP-N-acetylenolpyruvoylglucosamine reductase [Halomonas sp. 1513]
MRRLEQNHIDELKRICPGGVKENVSLAAISRWRIGGVADVIVEPSTVAELCSLRTFIAQEYLPSVVIGDTSNLLFSDEGLRAVCIRLSSRMSSVHIENNIVYAQAGVWVPFLARKIMLSGLTGAEHTCGIPGTLGGLICMNGGSQRKGIGSSVVTVESVDAAGNIHQRDAEQCEFSYRSSVCQSNSEVIASAKLSFLSGDKLKIRQEMLSILAERNRKFPRKMPNCGSVFKSNPAMYEDVGPPGAVIERIGLKGFSLGKASVSCHHANFIVNYGGARASDVLGLIELIVNRAADATGYRMEVEARYIHPNGMIFPADKIG